MIKKSLTSYNLLVGGAEYSWKNVGMINNQISLIFEVGENADFTGSILKDSSGTTRDGFSIITKN